MEKAKKRNSVVEMLENGSILKVFGTKALVSVCPAFSIERVRVSIVTLGTGGKDKLDTYLTVEEFRQFCREIDSGVCRQKLAADVGKYNYPQTYRWVHGNDGRNKLSIGPGAAGVLIQISDKPDGGKDVYKMSVVQYADLESMSFMFKLVSGLVTAAPGSYYASYIEAYNRFVEKGWREPDYTADDEIAASMAVSVESDDAGNETLCISEQSVSDNNECASEPELSSMAVNPVSESFEDLKEITIIVQNEPVERKNGFVRFPMCFWQEEDCLISTVWNEETFATHKTYMMLNDKSLGKAQIGPFKVKGKMKGENFYIAQIV